MNIKSKLSSLIENTFESTNQTQNNTFHSPNKTNSNTNPIPPTTKPVTYALPPNDFKKISFNIYRSPRSDLNSIQIEENKGKTTVNTKSPLKIQKTELFKTFSTICTSPERVNDCLKLTINRNIHQPNDYKRLDEVEKMSFKSIAFNGKDEETLENMIDKLRIRIRKDNYNRKELNIKIKNNMEMKYLKKELICSSPIRYSINKPYVTLSSNRFDYNLMIDDYLTIRRKK